MGPKDDLFNVFEHPLMWKMKPLAKRPKGLK